MSTRENDLRAAKLLLRVAMIVDVAGAILAGYECRTWLATLLHQMARAILVRGASTADLMRAVTSLRADGSIARSLPSTAHVDRDPIHDSPTPTQRRPRL